MEKFIEIDRALELLLKEKPQLKTEVSRLEDSFNRILACDIYTKFPIPNFRKSPFDGYCLTSVTTKGASKNSPITLKVNGIIKAGDDICNIENGIYKIMTGAQVPDFCDVVIKKEDTDCGFDNVQIYKEVISGENVIKIGEDVELGAKIISSGTKIKPGVVAMLAANGIADIEVYKMPKVALITTGDEIIDLGEKLTPGMVYNSNKYALLAFMEEIGLKATTYGVAIDTIEDLTEKFKVALEENDVIITTGGVSVGDYDYIGDVYEKLNIKKIFWSVKMKPGTPVMAGSLNGKLVISLPGSPAASLITYEVLVKPILKYLLGYHKYIPSVKQGIMLDDFKKLSKIPRFLRVIASCSCNGYKLALSGKQNAGVLHSMLNFNALAMVVNPDLPVSKGDVVEFIFINGDEA